MNKVLLVLLLANILFASYVIVQGSGYGDSNSYELGQESGNEYDNSQGSGYYGSHTHHFYLLYKYQNNYDYLQGSGYEYGSTDGFQNQDEMDDIQDNNDEIVISDGNLVDIEGSSEDDLISIMEENRFKE